MALRNHFIKVAIVSMSFIIIIFGAYANSYGAKYYVDKSANGANNGTSWTNAWESFGAINWSSVSPGDKIEVSGGSSGKTYYERLSIYDSGSSGNYITVMASDDSGHNGTVKIDGGGSRSTGIYVSGRKYLIIAGFKVQNTVGTGDGAIDINDSSYITVRNCNVTNATDRGIFFDKCSNSTAKDNTVDTGFVSNNQQTDGIYVQRGSDNVIDGNTVVLRNAGNSAHNDPLQVFNETRTTIRNNYCEIVAGRGNNVSQGMMIERIYDWLKIYNNVVLGSDGQPWQQLLIDQKQGYERIANLYCWNNTVIDQHGNGTALRVAHWASANVVEIKNNIGISNTGVGFRFDEGSLTPSKVDYNCWYTNGNYVAWVNGNKTWSSWQNAGYDPHGIDSDPGLGANFEPDGIGAPVVDSGVSIGAFSTDKEGTSRPRGSAWDIGAYEYPDNNISNEQPKPPSNLHIIN